MTTAPALGATWRVAWQGRSVLGEGPIYDPRNQCVWWVDIKGKVLHAFHPDGRASRAWALPNRIGSLVVPDRHWGHSDAHRGRFLCAGDTGFAWLRIDGDRVVIDPIVHPEPHLPGNRFNDGKLGPDGRYYAGTMDDAELAASGSLYALAPNGEVTVVDTGYRVPNGPAFSPDARFMYHTDSAQRTIYRFPLTADGTALAREIFYQGADGEGYPDGMTCDADGRLYVALWDGHAIAVLSPDGGLEARIPMPTARPTSCLFVPGVVKRLYVTSAAIGLDLSDAHAGGLFEVRFAEHAAG